VEGKNGQFLLEENTPCNNACYNEIDYHEVFFSPWQHFAIF
jgi:hypothetical protein